MKRIAFLFTVLLLCILLSSCNRKIQAPEEKQKYPDIILENASYAFGRSGDHPITFNAKKVTIFKDSTELEEVVFDSPEAFLSGNCNRVKVTDDNTKATLEGNVRLVKSDDDIIIVCEVLDWDNDKGLITCDGEVEVTYGNGTYIRGSGFTGQTEKNGYSFTAITEGRYTTDENKN